MEIHVRDKIVVYLYNYRHIDIFGNSTLPWEITQDGIAASVYISRAHACIEIKKLTELGMAEFALAHVKGSRYRRMSYRLTADGLKEYERIIDEAVKEGIDIKTEITDRFRSKVNRMSDASKEDMFVMGCASVLRIPVRRDLLPECRNITIPFDNQNRCIVNNTFRKDIQSMATKDQISSWHSFAADLWLDRADDMDDDITAMHERLYHLVNAGRNIDACRLISANSYDLLLTANEDLHDSILMIDPIPDRFLSDILPVRMAVDSGCMDIMDMEMCLDRMESIDHPTAELYRADIEYLKGNAGKAKNILNSIGKDNPMAAIRMAKILIDENRLEEARTMLSSVRDIASSEDTSVGVERFILLARIDKMEGRDSDAYAHLMKAKASISGKGKKRIDRIAGSMDLRV